MKTTKWVCGRRNYSVPKLEVTRVSQEKVKIKINQTVCPRNHRSGALTLTLSLKVKIQDQMSPKSYHFRVYHNAHVTKLRQFLISSFF